tara:strand:+ start:94 stop:324 length:231 start_codon:yes stop_codon:yes gene_type:complete
MEPVLFESINIYSDEIFFSSPPPFPSNEIIGIFLDLAYLASLIKLIDCFLLIFPPDVENKKRTSFLDTYEENSLTI